MEKSNYRRRVPESRRRTSNGTRETSLKGKKDFREVILMQSIVSAIVLASVMFICVVKTEFTINLRQNLKKALSTGTTAEEFKQTTDLVSSKYLFIQNTVKTIFGNTLDKGENATETTNEITNTEDQTDVIETMNQVTDKVNENTDSTIQQTDRIDEDILEKLNGADESSTDQKK